MLKNIHTYVFLYSQFSYSVCFESVNLLQYNWYKKKYEHNINIQFAYIQFHQPETPGKGREWHIAQLNCVGIHTAHACMCLKTSTSTGHRYVTYQARPYLVLQLSMRSQITSFHCFTITHQMKLFSSLLHKQPFRFFQGKVPYSL